MFERFADEARRATALASEEARKLGHDFIGTEHLLLGLLGGGEGLAFTVLTELEVTLADARQKVAERVHAYGSGSATSPPFTPLAKKALERALREALDLDSPVIGPEHLLLGLVDVPDGGGARVLVELAGSLDQVRRDIMDHISPSRSVSVPVIHSKAPVTSGARRRWAIPSRIGFTARPERAPGSEAEPESAGPEPRCPSCQSPLTSDARYRRVEVRSELATASVPTSRPEPATPPEAAVLASRPQPATPPDAAVLASRPEPATPPEAAGAEGPPRTEDPAVTQEAAGAEVARVEVPGAIMVTLVYCGHCGVTLGLA